MKFRFNILLALAAVGIAFSVATAQAAIVVGLNQIQYDNREQLATYNDTTHTYTAVAPGAIAVGDHLYGIFATTSETNNSPPPGQGVFDIVVAKIIDPTTGASIGAGYTGTAEVLFTTDSATLTGGETGGFLTGSIGTTYTLADGSTVNGLAQATDSQQALYQGSTLTPLTLDTLANQGAGITGATNGTIFSSFGLGAALTDTSTNSNWGAAGIGYWASDVRMLSGAVLSGTVPFVFGQVSTGLPNSSLQGLYNQLVPLQIGGEYNGNDATNIYTNAGSTPLTPDPFAGTTAVGGAGLVIPNPNTNAFAYVGGGKASSNTNGGPWPNTSADPTWVDPKTPEPGTMLLMGMGLVFGFPYLRRRRKAAA